MKLVRKEYVFTKNTWPYTKWEIILLNDEAVKLYKGSVKNKNEKKVKNTKKVKKIKSKK